MATKDDEKMVEAIKRGRGNPMGLTPDPTLLRHRGTTREERDSMVRGLTAAGMNNVDAIKEARRLERRNRLGRR